MALTLAAAKELSQDKLTNLVIDEFRKSALLDLLTFDNTVKPQGGKTLTYVYNRITTLPTAAGRAINTEYTPQETETTQQVVDLKIFGGSYQIDRVIQKNETQVLNHIEFQSKQKIQASNALFHDWFINGDSAVDTKAFDGLDKAITGSSTEYTPGSIIDLSSSAAMDTNWKIFLDAMRTLRARLDGTPSVWLMNIDLYGRFQSVMDRAGINLASKDNYGMEVSQWGPALVMALGDKPGTSNPIIPVTGGNTSMYVARLSLDGVHGVSPEGDKLVETFTPDMKAPGAVKKGEVEMVAAVAMKATKSAGALRDIKVQ